LIALQVTTAADHDIKTKGLQKVQSSLRNPDLKYLRPAIGKKRDDFSFYCPRHFGEDFWNAENQGYKERGRTLG
ncbi:hypothetical protein F5887DRAFT_910368, partial [Amanita rubescens]